MTVYVKGFKIDRQKVADMAGVPRGDPLVDAGIRSVVDLLNRSDTSRLWEDMRNQVLMDTAHWH